MTDQLETDLRALLHDRATTVLPDPATGERAVATRLADGTGAAADVLVVPARRSRRPLLLAAAAVLVTAIGAGLVLADRSPSVQIDAAGPEATGTTLLPTGALGSTVRFDGVVARSSSPCAADEVGDANGGCLRLAGSVVPGHLVLAAADAEEQPDGSWGVRLAFSDSGRSLVGALAASCLARTPECPSGQVVVLLDDVAHSLVPIVGAQQMLDGLVLRGFGEVEARTLARDLTASIGQVPPGVDVEPVGDPLLGDEGDAAKDVAERVLAELLGDPSVTIGAEDRDDATFVTLETSTGAEVVARVVFDLGPQRYRLTDVASPGLSGTFAEGRGLTLQVPEAGVLRIHGFSEDFADEQTSVDGLAVEAGTVGPVIAPDRPWVSLELTTSDGRVLRVLSRR
jgi:hypothetical protein